MIGLFGLGASLLSLPLTMTGGFRADAPLDAAPPIVGLLLDARLFLIEDAYTGLEVTYGGGFDDRNPERLRVCGKLEAAVTQGFRPQLGDTLALGIGARLGVTRVDGWPRGTLPSLHAYGPLLGVEGSAAWVLGHAWGHPMSLETRVGYTQHRLDGSWRGDPSVGLYVTGQLLPEPETPTPDLPE